ncbi:MAG TPA: hypothetical protein PKM88_07730 [bacterium]|mgnify:CR=1 FL=1|nr:hypothetical protein [bacterium]
MVRIVVLGHNRLAGELCSTASLICGCSAGINSFNLLQDEGQDALLAKLTQFSADHAAIDEYLFLVDIFGGSCFQVARKFLRGRHGRIMTGVNLNTMLEAQLGATCGLDCAALVEKLQAAAHKGIMVVEG